jgi:uncharacterized protein
MNSCLYEGRVIHERTQPVHHRFAFPLFMMGLDLGELDSVFRGRWFWSARRPALGWFRRSDHFGDARRPLDEAVRDAVETRLGRRPTGRIELITHLRNFGFAFNPISIYLCHGEGESAVEAYVLEVTNTPWRERCVYVIDGRRGRLGGSREVYEFDKEMHVSPFMGMNYRYSLEVQRGATSLRIRLKNRGPEGVPFVATLGLRRHRITGRNLARVLLAYPFMTFQIVIAIYFQAARLAWKRAPFYSHPAPRRAAREAPQS